MTTRIDWRKTCAELIENVRYLIDCVDRDCFDPVTLMECREHLSQTRTALSQPEHPSDGGLTVSLRMDLSSECLKRLCDGLAAAVKPNGGYREITTDDDIASGFTGDQQVGVTWWLPEYGCDSLENTLDAIKGRLLVAVRNWLPTAVADTTTIEAVPAPMSADTLAAIIREVDGTHRLGAAALAEAILAHPAAINAQPAPVPVPEPEGVTEEMVEDAARILYTAMRFERMESTPPWAERGNSDAQVVAREVSLAVLTRYARPTIESVPVAERPEPEDCDAEERCWWFRPADFSDDVSVPSWHLDVSPGPGQVRF
jgi:hypothetical protein